jgi:magnesium chelatase family protein
LIDRVDIFARVPRLPAQSLEDSGAYSEDTATVARRVRGVWEKRAASRKEERRDMDALRDRLSADGKKWAARAYESHRLTARGYLRMLLLAKTIADLHKEDRIGVHCLAEAIEYRLGAEELL